MNKKKLFCFHPPAHKSRREKRREWKFIYSRSEPTSDGENIPRDEGIKAHTKLKRQQENPIEIKLWKKIIIGPLCEAAGWWRKERNVNKEQRRRRRQKWIKTFTINHNFCCLFASSSTLIPTSLLFFSCSPYATAVDDFMLFLLRFPRCCCGASLVGS